MNSGAIHNCTPSPGEGEVIRHLYVHIPFCARICPYCAFYKARAGHPEKERFCQALLQELASVQARFKIRPETVFFGGGTPTALTTSQLDSLLRGFRDQLDLAATREWTIEANPGSVSRAKAATLHRAGVTRVSLGVQSWDDELLQLLGREHNAAQAEASFHVLREAGFTNLSIDLMFGLPGQTLGQWEAALEKTVALGPEHISTYCLTYEEDTEFLARAKRGEFREDPDAEAQFFESALRILERAEYRQYEISNYARDGFASAHNCGYWAGEDYLGLGPSAFSTVGLQRWQNMADYGAYADRVLRGETTVSSTEILTPVMKRGEQIALGLRTRSGVSSEYLKPWPDERREFLALNLLREMNGNFVLTPRGRLLADSVAAAFI